MKSKYKKYIEVRVLQVADYIVSCHSTYRAAAIIFKISKSTVAIDMVIRLKYINLEKYNKVRNVILENKEQRSVRGGITTQKLWKRRRDLL